MVSWFGGSCDVEVKTGNLFEYVVPSFPALKHSFGRFARECEDLPGFALSLTQSTCYRWAACQS